MKANNKKLLNVTFTVLFIMTGVGCLAEATEQHYSSEQENQDDSRVESLNILNVPDSRFLSSSSSSLPVASPSASNETSFVCVINSPYEVRRFELKCDDAEYLDVTVADCCIKGDVWRAKTKVWDKKPNIAIAVTPENVNQKSSISRVYNYGGSEQNEEQLTALIECSYKSGTNVFPAAALFTTKSNGFCVMKDLGAQIKMQ